MNIFWAVTSQVLTAPELLPGTHCVFLSLTRSSTFLFLWDWEKGKRSLAVRWNALIAIWTPVSLRILNWPAVMSQYSELGDPSPPHTYQLSPRLSLAVLPGQAVNAHVWQCGLLQLGLRAIGNVCLRGQICFIRNTSYHGGRKCML